MGKMQANGLYDITLTRDDILKPWGFSMAGGQQCGRDLFVSRVLSTSVAHGALEPGDMVVGINGFDVRTATLYEATSLAKHTRNQINLVVERKPMREIIVLQTPSCLSSW